MVISPAALWAMHRWTATKTDTELVVRERAHPFYCGRVYAPYEGTERALEVRRMVRDLDKLGADTTWLLSHPDVKAWVGKWL